MTYGTVHGDTSIFATGVRFVFGAGIAVLVLVSVSCRPSEETELQSSVVTSRPSEPALTRSARAESTSAEDTPGSPSSEPGRRGLGESGAPRRNATAVWETEAVSEAVGRQLDVIGEFVIAEREASTDPLTHVVIADFRCGPIRPDRLTTVFSDGAFRVLRPAHATTDPTRTTRTATAADGASGAAALRFGLVPLRRLIQATPERHFKFKTIRVELDGEDATTRSIFQLAGTSSDTAVQQKSVWQCRWRLGQRSAPRLRSVDVSDYEEVIGNLPSGPMFADCTESALGHTGSFQKQMSRGVDYWLERIERRHGIVTSGWSGITIGDVNGDGWEDAYIPQPGGLPNRLYVQSSDGSFVDTSHEAGVDYWDRTQAALFVDLDNDGDQDLIVSTRLGVIFAANDGSGHFTQKGIKLAPDGQVFSLSAADFDDDGDLDIYVGCYKIRETQGSDSYHLFGIPIPYHDANNGARNMLLENRGGWQFRDVTRRVGLDQNNRRFTLASSWEDYDNDGDADLYVANDFGRNNLFRNDDGRFVDVAAEAGVEDVSAGMSVSWGDYNNDGWMDIYVSNMFSSAGGRVAFQRRFLSGVDASIRSGFQRHAKGNSLFMNSGNGQFVDVSESAAVTMGRWAWASRFVDINNDMLDDIVVANGFLTRDDPGDL